MKLCNRKMIKGLEMANPRTKRSEILDSGVAVESGTPIRYL